MAFDVAISGAALFAAPAKGAQRNNHLKICDPRTLIPKRSEGLAFYAQQAHTNPYQIGSVACAFHWPTASPALQTPRTEPSGHGFSRAKNNRREAPSSRGALPASPRPRQAQSLAPPTIPRSPAPHSETSRAPPKSAVRTIPSFAPQIQKPGESPPATAAAPGTIHSTTNHA
jgi:hypothetical protein